MIKIKKKRVEYTYKDINNYDLDILKQAYFLQQNDPTSFVCFGRHYPKLAALKLIDGECQPTQLGRDFCKYMMGKNPEQ